MSSVRQIEANRRNSQNSTGPRSPEGKAVSRFNALTSGIHAQSQVIPGEDPAELTAVASAYHDEFQPATPLECFLVDALIRADWQLRRLHRVEAQLWNSEIARAQKADDAPHEPALLGLVYRSALDVFTRLQRRIDSAERAYYRALAQLQRRRAPAPVGLPSEISPQPSPEPVEDSLLTPELGSFQNIRFPDPPGDLPAPSPVSIQPPENRQSHTGH